MVREGRPSSSGMASATSRMNEEVFIMPMRPQAATVKDEAGKVRCWRHAGRTIRPPEGAEGNAAGAVGHRRQNGANPEQASVRHHVNETLNRSGSSRMVTGRGEVKTKHMQPGNHGSRESGACPSPHRRERRGA